MCVCVVFNNSAVLYRLCRRSSLKWIKMQQFSLPLPYLHSFICWTNMDQVKLPPPDYMHITWAKRVRWRPTARTSTQNQPSLCGLGRIHVTMTSLPFSTLCQNNVIDHPEDFFFFFAHKHVDFRLRGLLQEEPALFDGFLYTCRLRASVRAEMRWSAMTG